MFDTYTATQSIGQPKDFCDFRFIAFVFIANNKITTNIKKYIN